MLKKWHGARIRTTSPLDRVIGEWLVSPTRNRIVSRRSGAVVSVEPLLMRLLSTLADRPGMTVSKDQLVEDAWRGVVVSDEAIAQAASRLRRLLNDDPRCPVYIETVRKIGYRLAAPVMPVAAERRPRPQALAAAASIGAVLLSLLLYFSLGAKAGAYRLLPVAVDARDERRASISPDGSHLAYEMIGEDGASRIWLSGAGGSADAFALTDTEGAEAPVWLSNHALAMQYRSGEDCTVVRYDLTTRLRRRLGDCDGSGYADLAASSDGRFLAFNAGARDRPKAIHMLEPGGATRQLTRPPSNAWGDYDPEFSPGGGLLLFIRAASEGQQDLYIVDSTGRERRLTSSFGNIYGATWSGPTEVIYSGRSLGRYGLRRIDVRTGRDDPVPAPASDLVRPVMRDGLLLAESRKFQSRVVVGGMGSKGLSWPNSSGLNLHPALSRDGRLGVFVSDRSGSLELWIVDLETGKVRQLTSHRGPFVGTPRFTPDGTAVVYEIRRHDQGDIWMLDVRSGRSRPLVSGSEFDTAPSVSADGRKVYFASYRGSEWSVYFIDLMRSGSPKLLLRNAFAALEAPDGSALYFTRRDRKGLFRYDRSGGTTSVVESSLAVEDWGAFAPVSNGVVFVDRSTPGAPRLVLAAANGERRIIQSGRSRIPSHDPVLAVQPNLERVLHVEAEAGTADILRLSR